MENWGSPKAYKNGNIKEDGKKQNKLQKKPFKELKKMVISNRVKLICFKKVK